MEASKEEMASAGPVQVRGYLVWDVWCVWWEWEGSDVCVCRVRMALCDRRLQCNKSRSNCLHAISVLYGIVFELMY